MLFSQTALIFTLKEFQNEKSRILESWQQDLLEQTVNEGSGGLSHVLGVLPPHVEHRNWSFPFSTLVFLSVKWV